jgi:DNA polymerase alpha/epsilon subunit B
MPGEHDPANLSLPQQPFNACLLPLSNHLSTCKPVSNPYEAEIGGRVSENLVCELWLWVVGCGCGVGVVVGCGVGVVVGCGLWGWSGCGVVVTEVDIFGNIWSTHCKRYAVHGGR